MADERTTSSGWLPPVAPGPRVPQTPPSRPTFERPSGTRPSAPQATGGAQAVWALVLALVALALLLLSLGTLFFVTLPCSIGALVLAGRARRRAGSGQATAALWIARVGVIAGVASGIVLIALIAAGVDLEQVSEDLRQRLEEQRER